MEDYNSWQCVIVSQFNFYCQQMLVNLKFECNISMSEKGLEALEKASAAEAEAVSAHWAAAMAAAADRMENEEPIENNNSSDQASENVVTSGSTLMSHESLESDVRLHHRAVWTFLLSFLCYPFNS